jgi:hypothetical protein
MMQADWLMPVLFAAAILLAGLGLMLLVRRNSGASTRHLIGRELGPRAFEEALSAGLRLQGYHVEGTQQKVIVMRRSGEITLVSYLGWERSRDIRRRLRELYRTMRQQNAAGGKLVCAIEMPDWFHSASEAHSVEWIGPGALFQLLELGIAQQSPQTVQLITSFMPGHTVDTDDTEDIDQAIEPERRDAGQKCPRCGAGMTLETASQGAALGQKFWRCVRIDECKGIRVAHQP